MATVIYGVTSEPYDKVTFSAAGHWPPIVAHADGSSTIVEAAHDLALGIDASVQRTTFDVVLEPGGALCLFTDGLLEVQHDVDPEQVLKDLAAHVAELDASESADTAVGCCPTSWEPAPISTTSHCCSCAGSPSEATSSAESEFRRNEDHRGRDTQFEELPRPRPGQ